MSHNKSTTLADEGFLSDETAAVIETVAVHSSSRDIEQHFQVDNAGNLHALINEPVLEGLDMLYLILGEILVVCGRFLGEVFEFNTTECEASMARLHTLWEKHAC